MLEEANHTHPRLPLLLGIAVLVDLGCELLFERGDLLSLLSGCDLSVEPVGVRRVLGEPFSWAALVTVLTTPRSSSDNARVWT